MRRRTSSPVGQGRVPTRSPPSPSPYETTAHARSTTRRAARETGFSDLRYSAYRFIGIYGRRRLTLVAAPKTRSLSRKPVLANLDRLLRPLAWGGERHRSLVLRVGRLQGRLFGLNLSRCTASSRRSREPRCSLGQRHFELAVHEQRLRFRRALDAGAIRTCKELKDHLIGHHAA